MFDQLAEHQRTQKKIRLLLNNGNCVGTVQGIDDDRESDARDYFKDIIKCSLDVIPDYHFSDLDNPHDWIIVDDKPLNQWKESELYEYADKAKFGDVLSATTKEDDNVRKGRDITADKFIVKQCLIYKIKQIWLLIFNENVTVKPYKINVYKKGDFFLSHADSPEDGLIGTTLIDVSNEPGKSFRIDGNKWNSLGSNTCSFYADIQHEVKPIKNDYRVTIAFKIYSNQENNFKLELISNTDQIKNFGILLKHGYSYKDNTMKGVDRIICENLYELGWKFDIVPVVVQETVVKKCDYNLAMYDDFDGNLSIYVSPEEIIEKHSPNKWNKLISEWHNSRKLRDDIPFIVLNNGYRWDYNVETGVFIGNTHDGLQLSTTYLNKALIVYKSM